MTLLNPTHDPARRSWLASANIAGADFPIQNLPLGMFRITAQGEEGPVSPGVAIGDQVIDLRGLDAAGLLQGDAATVVRAVAPGQSLNGLMALGGAPASALRARLSGLLREGGDPALQQGATSLLQPMASVTMALPCAIGDFSDFLTSYFHTERHGRFKGLGDPVPPVFHSLPVAYHGRASSIRVSGTSVHRPNGQWREADGRVVFGPVQAMDFELELAALIGRGNTLGEPVPLDRTAEHIFGYALLNDWSAKSVQWWEQMLGPFLGKSFMTSLSPWVVTAEALAPFAMAAPSRPDGVPPLLPYLDSPQDRRTGGLNISLQAWLRTQAMRDGGQAPVQLCATHLSNLCWTFGQMLAHQTTNGCNLLPGDVLGSGTISGAQDFERACLTEITRAGKEPLQLPNGEQRLWLHDGDEIRFTAQASAPGRVSIGFGTCSGTIVPAIAYPPGAAPATR